ncbi:MAG: hypothetical protein M3443_04740 [Actinomycetota bacterium]|nr:hypothetical protein [Actinomycetota bacterium]
MLFDPFLFRALCKVARGEIGATDANAALRHRSEDLSPRLFSALCMLRRAGFVRLSSAGPDPHCGWISAELSTQGSGLLGEWTATIRAGTASPPPPRPPVSEKPRHSYQIQAAS